MTTPISAQTRPRLDFAASVQLQKQRADLRKKFRIGVRPSRSCEDGVRAFRVGLNFGYWPCLGGPFVQIYTGFWAIGIWWGTASYLTGNGHDGI